MSDTAVANGVGASIRPAALARTVLATVARGGARLVWWWPGIVIVVAAYVAVAVRLYDHSYSNLWGGLAAVVVAAAWYGSPLRRLEARRRARLRSVGATPEASA